MIHQGLFPENIEVGQRGAFFITLRMQSQNSYLPPHVFYMSSYGLQSSLKKFITLKSKNMRTQFFSGQLDGTLRIISREYRGGATWVFFYNSKNAKSKFAFAATHVDF